MALPSSSSPSVRCQQRRSSASVRPLSAAANSSSQQQRAERDLNEPSSSCFDSFVKDLNLVAGFSPGPQGQAQAILFGFDKSSFTTQNEELLGNTQKAAALRDAMASWFGSHEDWQIGGTSLYNVIKSGYNLDHKASLSIPVVWNQYISEVRKGAIADDVTAFAASNLIGAPIYIIDFNESKTPISTTLVREGSANHFPIPIARLGPNWAGLQRPSSWQLTPPLLNFTLLKAFIDCDKTLSPLFRLPCGPKSSLQRSAAPLGFRKKVLLEKKHQNDQNDPPLSPISPFSPSNHPPFASSSLTFSPRLQGLGTPPSSFL